MRRRDVLGLLGGAAASPLAAQEPTVQTVTGPLAASELGLTLIHEHVITDLRDPPERRGGDYDPDDAFQVALPYLEALRAAGGETLVEPTPIFIGRDPAGLRRLSEASRVRIICATGVYGAAGQRFIPDDAREEPAERLAERYLEEIENGIGSTGVRPGLIKTGVNRETPLPEIERKLVRAALLAGKQSGLTVASHTGPAAPALEELELIHETGFDPNRFIWVHAQNETDLEQHRRLARQGVWVELDGVNASSAERHLAAVRSLAEADLLGRTLISQDAGWYRPGPERGSQYRGYTFLLEEFVPMLRSVGFSEADVRRLLVENPARALAG